MVSHIQFKQGTVLPPPNPTEIAAFEEWLRKTRSQNIVFGQDYLEFVKANHGGIPVDNRFITSTGKERMIVRFLNFVDSDHPLSQYSVEGTWGLISDRVGKHLVPFAELFAGDMLCFDFSESRNPQVVVWLHEMSEPQSPVVDYVAPSFEEFIKMVY